MKKLVTPLLCLCLLLSLTVTASADILWEPYTNAYYDYDKVETVAAAYVVPEGMTVNVYESPETPAVLTTWQAGTRVYVGFRQTVDGQVWGVGYAYGDYENEGWFRLGRLQKEYSHNDFMSTFGADCTEDESLVLTADDITGTVHTWTYPGSGTDAGSIPAEAVGGDYNNGVISFRTIYTDPDGGRWGHVGYYMGRVGWVYLEDPCAAETPLFIQTPVNTVTDSSPTEEPPAPGLSLWLVAALTAAVVAATAVLLALTRRKR